MVRTNRQTRWMDYPIDRDHVDEGVRRLLAADPLTNGDVPGFTIVNDIAGGAVRLTTLRLAAIVPFPRPHRVGILSFEP
jgi:hypothetical protein